METYGYVYQSQSKTDNVSGDSIEWFKALHLKGVQHIIIIAISIR